MAILKYYNTATSAWEYIAASTTANFTSWKKTMSGGETSVSGTDDNAVTLSYTVGLEQVFINGVLQVRGTDYTATNGTSVTGLSALVANDIVTVVCYAPFNVANTIAPTVVDAKGDLIAGTAADTVGRLAVGTDGQLLSADSSTATGLKWANGGLTLLSTTSFSAVSSVSLTADTFTSTYDNYKILIRLTTSGGTGYVQMRLRAAGSDNTTSNYDSSGIGRQANASTTAFESANDNIWYVVPKSAADTVAVSMDLLSPKLVNNTLFTASVQGVVSTHSTTFNIGGIFKATTSFDSASFISSVSTITGSVSVYGYNK